MTDRRRCEQEHSAQGAELPGLSSIESRLSIEDPAFSAWVRAMPDKHWAKYDLSAVRLGYELARTTNASVPVAPFGYYNLKYGTFWTDKDNDAQIIKELVAEGELQPLYTHPLAGEQADISLIVSHLNLWRDRAATSRTWDRGAEVDLLGHLLDKLEAQ